MAKTDPPKGGKQAPTHDPAATDDGKTYGLVLDLGGAPDTPHVIPGLPGLYLPNRAVPVGGDGDLSLDAAIEASKSRGVPVSLVEVPKTKADDLREQSREDRRLSLGGVRDARRNNPTVLEQSLLAQEAAATRQEA